MDIGARSVAKEQGIERFFTGKPCKYGHISERYTSFGGCVECTKKLAASEAEKERLRQWRAIPKNRRTHAEAQWRRKGMPMPTREKPLICELCGEPPKGHGLSLDHCHEANRFRGWLCSNCNHALGKIGDNLIDLQRWSHLAEKYLRRSLG